MKPLKLLMLLTLSLVCLFLTPLTGFAQEPLPHPPVELGSALTQALNQVLVMTNWVYVITFILLTILFNEYTEAKTMGKWLNWLKPIPRFFRAVFMGIILILLFYFGFQYHTRADVTGLFFGIIMALLLYQLLGVAYMVDLIKKWIRGMLGVSQLKEHLENRID